MALRKMEQDQVSTFERVFFPGYRRAPDRSLFRTHPQTGERVRRLLELAGLEERLAPQESEVAVPWPQRPGWYVRGLR